MPNDTLTPDNATEIASATEGKKKHAKKLAAKIKGIFEKVPGSDVWWIRYADASGRIRREKAGTKGMAVKLYQKRKTEAMQGKKLPETLRQRDVTFCELAAFRSPPGFAGEA